MRLILIVLLSLGLVAGCAPTTSTSSGVAATGPDGQPLPTVYKIRASAENDIKFRMLDSVNALRRASGAPEVRFNARLNAAAATHSRDMSAQNRPWHFGSDGSSPIDRVVRSGYSGRFVGENISETYENENETLSAWMAQPSTREVILDPRATEMGFDWFQEKNGKIWWTLVMGGATGLQG